MIRVVSMYVCRYVSDIIKVFFSHLNPDISSLTIYILFFIFFIFSFFKFFFVSLRSESYKCFWGWTIVVSISIIVLIYVQIIHCNYQTAIVVTTVYPNLRGTSICRSFMHQCLENSKIQDFWHVFMCFS